MKQFVFVYELQQDDKITTIKNNNVGKLAAIVPDEWWLTFRMHHIIVYDDHIDNDYNWQTTFL